MNIIFFFTFLASFIIFLFSLYTLSRDDFVFIRKNVSVEEMFNTGFLLVPFMLLVSRIFYVVFHFNQRFLHVLVFLALPYFPGLSLLGAVLGGMLGIICICLIKKVSVIGRVSDIISLSLFAGVTCGIAPVMLIFYLTNRFYFLIELLFVILSIASFALLVKYFLKEKFKDGSVSLLFLVIFSLLSILSQGFRGIVAFSLFVKGEGAVYILIFFVCLILFIRREKVRFKFNFLPKKK